MRITCLLFLMLVSPALSIPDNVISAINELARQKRQSGGDCSTSCLSDIADTLKGSKPITDGAERAKTLTTCRWYTPDQVSAMCKIRADGTKCFDKCPTGETKTLGMKVLGAFFMCEDRFKNFSTNYPCIEKQCDDVDKTCSAQCQSQRGDADKLFSFSQGTKQRVSLDTAQKILGDACRYWACYTRCARPIWSEKCGNATADLESAIKQQTLQTIIDLIRALGLDSSVLPSVCTDFQNEDPEVEVPKNGQAQDGQSQNGQSRSGGSLVEVQAGGCAALVPFTLLIALSTALGLYW